uniref:Replication initiator protein n=1 Tax=Dulem virus 177 TaxID=3145654 RepID=A0AAU8AZJ5_9VIRU
MQCVNPFFLKDYGFYVPCNKCLYCRMTRSREWSFRISHEFETFKHVGSFLTLTYNPLFLPLDGSLSKKHLQGFHKLLRRRFKDPLKYFACGEYGGRFGRPHYHSLVLGVPPTWFHSNAVPGTAFRSGNGFGVYSSLWYSYDSDKKYPDAKGSHFLGHLHIAPVVPRSIQYVAAYVMKKVHVNEDFYQGLQPPFQLQSQGIGLEYAISHFDEFTSRHTYWNGKKIGVPRYYRKKIGTADDLPVSELNETASQYYSAVDNGRLHLMEYYENELRKLIDSPENSYKRTRMKKIMEKYKLSS